MNGAVEYSHMTPIRRRPDALRSAIRPGPKKLPPRFARWRFEAIDLIHEIRSTGRCLADPAAIEGERLFPSGPLWSLFDVLTRTRGVPAIADVARALRVSRQTAHRIVRSAARAGYVDLVPNPRDRRILQVELTDAGRKMLAVADAREAQWALVMLNGYSLHQLREVSIFLRLLRHRVLALEREREGQRQQQQQQGQRQQQRQRQRGRERAVRKRGTGDARSHGHDMNNRGPHDDAHDYDVGDYGLYDNDMGDLME